MQTPSPNFWFRVLLYHSLRPCFLMTSATTLLNYWRNRKSVTSQISINKHISSSNYTSPRSFSTICTSLSSQNLCQIFNLLQSCILQLQKSAAPNLLPSFLISSSSVAMHPQSPQLIIAAPLFTIIPRRFPHV